MLNLQDFIQKYTGQANVGDTPENTGQCVGLIECWTDNLNLPHTWGNADQLMADADTNSFDVIQNTPTGVPQAGDIICWSSAYNGTVGHTGIFVSGDANTFQCFEQNDPLGSTPHIKQYDYTDVQGWLHPKVALPTSNTVSVDSTTFTNLVTKSTAYDTFVAAGYSSVEDVTKKINDLQQQVDTAQTQIDNLKKQLEAASQPKVTLAVTTPQVPSVSQQLETSVNQAKQATKLNLWDWALSLFGLK